MRKLMSKNSLQYYFLFILIMQSKFIKLKEYQKYSKYIIKKNNIFLNS